MATEFDENDLDVVYKSEKPVIVDFYTPTCPPCRKMAPVVDKLAAEYKKSVLIGKCNAAENTTFAGNCSVNAVPTFVVFKKGKAVARHVGAMSEAEFRAFIEKHK